MAVAKSYIGLEVLTEPYEKNGRQYVEVKLKSGKNKEVRWYTDAEFEKMYPDTNVVKPTNDSIKKALGFQEGYITIFKGDQESNNDWFKWSNARWARYWGWYVVSTEEVPEQLPFGIEPVKLYWKDVAAIDGSGELKPEDKVKAIVDSLLYGESDSQFVGQIGDRLHFSSCRRESSAPSHCRSPRSYRPSRQRGQSPAWRNRQPRAAAHPDCRRGNTR